MKTKKTLWILLALLLVFTLALSACGGGETEEPATEEPAAEMPVAEEPATEEPMAEEPITLRVFAGNVGIELELTKAAAQRYMDMHPNITVEVIDTPDFVEDRMGVYLQLFEAQSSEGDIFQIDVIWPGDLAEHFVDLNEYGAANAAAEHFPAIIRNNTVDGKLVGIPWFTDAGLLYYRTDLLEKYGYDTPPTTWTELTDMAQTIQDGERTDGNQDFWGYVWQGNAYEGLTCDALEWIDSNGGGTIVSPDKVITINNAAAIQAADNAASWVGTISPDGVTGFGEEDARGVWQAGNAAFMRTGPTPGPLVRLTTARSKASSMSPRCPRALLDTVPPLWVAGNWPSLSTPNTPLKPLIWRSSWHPTMSRRFVPSKDPSILPS